MLQEIGPPTLCFEPSTAIAQPKSAQATAIGKKEQRLSAQAYMDLVATFEAAIDDKVYHRELCNKCTGMITLVEDGQQRRYILSEQSQERQKLELALHVLMGISKNLQA